MESIPVTGWIVIGVLGFLIFLLAWFKGFRVKKGDNELALGASTDKKLAKFRDELSSRKQAEQHDEELRKRLYRGSIEIDDRMKADMRRVVRSMNAEIFAAFEPYMRCDFPAAQVKNLIKDEFFQCIDENHLREKLSVNEIRGYLVDVLSDIQKEYRLFISKVGIITCGEAYPSWDEIQDAIQIMVFNWSERMKEVLINRMEEKIELYKSERDHFLLENFKQNSVDDPVEKNLRYLASLDEVIKNDH